MIEPQQVVRQVGWRLVPFLALYADSLLPQTRLTSDAVLAAYEVGNVDFLTLVSSSLAVFDVELAQVEQQRQLRRALVTLEALVGRALVK